MLEVYINFSNGWVVPFVHPEKSAAPIKHTWHFEDVSASVVVFLIGITLNINL